MDGLCHILARPRLRRVSVTVDRGWVLERGVWRADPGRGLLFAWKRQPEGMGVRSSTTRNVRGRSLGLHRNRAPLLSSLPHALTPASSVTRRGCCLSRMMHPAHCCLLCSHWPKLALAPLLPPPLPSAHLGKHMCSRAAPGADTSGRPTNRGGAETTGEPQEPCN